MKNYVTVHVYTYTLDLFLTFKKIFSFVSSSVEALVKQFKQQVSLLAQVFNMKNLQQARTSIVLMQHTYNNLLQKAFCVKCQYLMLSKHTYSIFLCLFMFPFLSFPILSYFVISFPAAKKAITNLKSTQVLKKKIIK